MKPRLWIVGVFCEGEMMTLGPFSQATAEAMFRRMSADPPPGTTPFLQPLIGRKGGWT